MSAGDLRERFTFSRRAEAEDGFGNTQGDWEDQFARAAGLKSLKGGESVLAARLTGVQPVVITVRYDSETISIEPDWRAVDQRSGRIYNITAAADRDGRRRYIDVLATFGLAAG